MKNVRKCPRCNEPIGISCPRCDARPLPDAVTKDNTLDQIELLGKRVAELEQERDALLKSVDRKEFGPGWPYRSAPERNYETDPAFRALVDSMVYQIYSHQFSPSEMRAAAVLACIKYEERVVRPVRPAPVDVLEDPPFRSDTDTRRGL